TGAGVFRGAGSTVTKIAQSGDPTPDSRGNLSAFRTPQINGSGQAAIFATNTSGNALTQSSIYRGAGGPLTAIASSGALPRDGTRLYGRASRAANPTLNDAGTVAFLAPYINAGGSFVGSGVTVSDGVNSVVYGHSGATTPDGQGTFNTTFVETVQLNNAGQV